MDFLDPKKKKSHRIRLYIGYALISLIIGVSTLLLVFQAYGYNLDMGTGMITQNGLVFVSAQPETADIFIDGQPKGQTGRRLILPAGDYRLELKREGYRPWERQFKLEGGRIERFVYPFLFPQELVTTEAQLFAARSSFVTQSPNRRWLLTQQPNEFRQFSLIDLNSEIAAAAALELPESLVTETGAAHSFSLVEWSDDNRHVLVKHNFTGGSEFILLDRQEPDQSQNLSRVFRDVSFTDLRLRDKTFDNYYLFDQPAGQLFEARLEPISSELILEDVIDFRSHGDNVLLYVTANDDAKNEVLVRVREDDQNYTVWKFPSGSKYLLDIARFNDSWYVVAGAVKEQKVYVLRDPVEILRQQADSRLIPASIMRIEDAEHVSFSNNARFVAVQAGSRFVVYDAETDRNYGYETDLPLRPRQQAIWMDGHRLAAVSDEAVTVFDYDGINRQRLSAGYNGSRPYFDSNYQNMYTLAPSQDVQGRAALLKTELIVERAD